MAQVPNLNITMKTHKNLYKKLCSLKNLYLAYKKARKGKTKKPYVKRFESNLHENLKELHEQLLTKTYKPVPLKQFTIRDPKTRKINKSIFRDRIIHHAIINIIGNIFEKSFISDSYASIKGRGQHKALERFDYFKRKITKNGKKLNGIKDNNYVIGYCLKADIAHYFDTIDHKILINIIKTKIKDQQVLWLIKQVLQNTPQCRERERDEDNQILKKECL